MIVRPTSRGWCIAANAAIWMCIAQVNHSLLAMFLACASMAVLIASFVASLFTLRGIQIKRRPFDQLHVGKLVNFPLECVNLKKHRRQPIVILETLKFAQNRKISSVLSPMAGHEKRVVNRAVMPSARGAYKLGKIVLRSADPAGIFCREKAVVIPEAVVVYPSVEQLDSLELGEGETLATAVGGNPTSTAGYSQDFYGVREYHPTDGMRFIHWKSTAHRNKLMVREFERMAQTTVAIFIDGVAGKVTPDAPALHLEATLIAAASICQYLSRRICNLAIGIGGASPKLLPPKPVAENWRDAMLLIATMQSGQVPLSAVIDDMLPVLPARSVVYCFSLNETEALRNELGALVERGMDVRWYHASKAAFKAKLHHPLNVEQWEPETEWSLVPRRMSPSLSMAQMLR